MRTEKRFSPAVVATVSLALLLAAPFAVFAAGPSPVDLLSVSSFAVLSKTGVTDTGSHTSSVTGNIGSSPVTAAAMNGVFCSEVSGTIYGVDAAYVGSGNQTCFAGNPPSANKTMVDNAVLDMGTAYADAAGRTNPSATELGAGNLGGLTIAPGLYKWGTDVTIPTSLTLSGGANDVWIFQIAGNLNVSAAGNVASGAKINLIGGAKASNVFWQVGGLTGATIGTYATFNGTILSAKQVILETGATLNGRALAQTQVTLDYAAVTVPSASSTPPSESNPPPYVPPVTYNPPAATTSTYNRAAEQSASPTIDADKSLSVSATRPSPQCPANTLVKGSGRAVYYCGDDGKRYVFPNDKVFFSWYANFSAVRTISDASLGSIMIGGNVTYRPGTRLIKINTDPKVYAIAKGGVLRWIQTEAIARTLYGTAWKTQVDDISDAFFVNYRMGEAVSSAQ